MLIISRKMSYFQKQLSVVIGINFLSLVVAGTLLYSSFVNDYQDNLLDTVKSRMNMLIAASTSALLFDDKEAATRVLTSLSQSPNTRFAEIYTLEKQPFSRFVREGHSIDVSIADLQPGFFFQNENLYIFKPIELDNETLGYMLLSADTLSLQQQNQRYLRIIGVVFAITMLLAYLLNWRLQIVMAAPLNRLVGLMSYVAKERKYDKRIEVRQVDDEVGTLVNGVNSMLDTIEQHEQQLQENSERLESLVTLRTEQLFQRANYDALTQLPNRHLLIDRLNHGIDNADWEKSSMALMFLDLDRFKVINDSLGHSIGDQLLTQVAKKLSNLVNKVDSVCRWGGDEFVVLVEHLQDKNDVEKLAQNIIDILNQPMEIAGHRLHISTSIGIARYPQDGADSVTLLKHADISMYRAKANGPGKYSFFKSTMLDDSVYRLSLESQIRHAAENAAFHLVYQPQICVKSNSMCGFEALIRWDHEGRLIPPNEFLPVVEEIGLMTAISEWVLRTACQQNAKWQQEGLSIVPIAVNLTADFIIQPNSFDLVESILAEYDLAPRYLEIEITENTFVASTEIAIKTIERLRKLGVSVAIDDFGTGYSCMSYLRDLPVNKLKIDGSFVQHLGQSTANDGIVKSIITLGNSLDLIVVGECIENEQQREMLEEMGCDMIQGYLYSKPLPAEKAQRFLNNEFQADIAES